MDGGITATRGRAKRQMRVWDLPTRLFHWVLVVLVVALIVTGKTGQLETHALVGQAVLVLIVYRLVWGVVGSETARFSDFLRGPKSIFQYVAGAVGLGPVRPVLGHNPAGGLMVVALLLVLLAQAVSGLFATDDIMFDGPLVALVSSAFVKTASFLHRQLADLILILIGLHVVAVLAYLLVKKDNLIRPMITGRRQVPADPTLREPRLRSTGLAATILAVVVAGLGTGLYIVQQG